VPATDQDRPPQKKLAHTKPRTNPRGYPVVEQEMRLTYEDERDRRRSDSAGAPMHTRGKSHAESWEDMHTPPQADAELWRAIRQVGIDINGLSDDVAEMRVAFMSLLTNVLDRVLEQKDVIVTSQVKVQETGALTNIHDRSEREKMKRDIMRKWLIGTLATAFAALAGALIHRYL
jgi:hypothetical protein